MPRETVAQILGKISDLFTAAFGLVAALAWNNAITAFVTKVFGAPNALLPEFIYAVAVTVLAVIVTVWMSRITAAAKVRITKRGK